MKSATFLDSMLALFRTLGHCIRLKTMAITCMTYSGHQSTLPYSRLWTALEDWTCGTLTTILRYKFWATLFRLNARETHLLLPPNLHHFAPLQVPTASTHSESMTSLNRLRWTHSGHQIAVGDDDGHVFIYDVGEVRELKRKMLRYWESNIRQFPLLQCLLPEGTVTKFVWETTHLPLP